jgi:molybdopterin-guanine dinucleotide biosynthesis protein A
MTPIVAGVLVGGAATRMGGRPKGLLLAPDGQAIVHRTLAILTAAGIGDIVLVGAHPAYEATGRKALTDDPGGIGPFGGLLSLLRYAQARLAVALACDMPFVSSALVERLISAPSAPVVAPRRDGRWEPLCARYDPPQVLSVAMRRAASNDYSLQRLLDDTGAVGLPLTPKEADELRDWDTMEDVESKDASVRPAER